MRQPAQRAAEVIHKQVSREAQLIPGEVEGGDAVAVGEQSLKLFLTGRLAEGAAQDADQAGFDVKVAAAFFHSGDHRLDNAGNGQLVSHRHIAWRETQFDVVQAVARGIFEVFIGDAAAGLQRGQHFYPQSSLARKLTVSGSLLVTCT